MRLTGRGWVLALFVPGAAGAAVLFGIRELYPVAAAAAALLVLATCWVASHRGELDSSRRLRPAYVAAGEAATAELTIANRADRRSPLVAATDPLEGGVSSAGFRVAPLEPGEEVTAAYHLPPVQRGRYLVGPLLLTLTDPFELVRRTRTGAPASSLTVHPAIVAVRPAPATASWQGLGAEGGGASGAAGDEFASLRPYLEGDDLRLVHWPSTARLDRVVVRQTEGRAQPRSTVAVDLRDGIWTAALLEEALAAAGGVLDAARNAGVAIRLLTASGEAGTSLDTGFGMSGAHWGRALDGLAEAQAWLGDPGAGSTPLAELLRHLGGAAPPGGEDTLTVITSSRATEADVAGLAALAPAASLIVVVFALGGAAQRTRATPPGRLVRVAEGQDFAAAWADGVAAWVQLAER